MASQLSLRIARDPMGPPPPDREVDKPRGAPSTQRFSSIPPTWISGIDRVPDIETAIATLSQGNFRLAALTADAAMRDERIWAVMDTRAGVIRGADVEVKPADATGKAAEIAQVLGGDDDNPGLWEQMFPSATIARLLRYGWMTGIAVAEIVWVPLDIAGQKMWMPRLVPVHPQFLYWDWGYRAYRLQMAEGTITLPDVTANPYSDGHWLVWCPFGYQYAWGEAMIKPLADLYLRRRWNSRDWPRYNEKHGSLADIAYVPEDADDDAKDAYFYDVANRGADSAIMVPRRDNQSKDSGYGIDILEPKGRGWETFRDTQEKLDNAVAILFWGQNLTTEVQAGAGSKAAENGHQKIADNKTQEDAAIARVLGQQVIPWWAHHNFGNADLAPRARYVVEPPTDAKDEGAGLLAIGQGAQALLTANPRTDVDAIYDAQGIPMRSEAEMAEIERQARERAQAMQPPPGSGGQAGGGQGGAQPAGGAPGGSGNKSEDGKDPDGKADKKATARLKNTGDGVVGHRLFQGFRVAVENPAGTVRFWHDPDGNETGRTSMKHDYGFFTDHLGADDEELDVYLGENEAAPYVYVVKQMRGPDFKKPDEDKVFLGFDSEAAARAAYAAHRNDGQAAIGAVTSMTLEQFRAQLKKRRGSGHITARAGGVAALRVSHGQIRARAKRQRLYADGVVESGKVAARRAMASYLHRVLAAIKGAHSYDEMRARVLNEFKHVRPHELEAIVAKARIMAKAGGMDTAWQQV